MKYNDHNDFTASFFKFLKIFILQKKKKKKIKQTNKLINKTKQNKPMDSAIQRL